MSDIHPIDEKLLTLDKYASPSERLDVVWRHYESMTNSQIAHPPAQQQRSEVHDWLLKLRGTGDDPMLALRRTRLWHPLFLSLAEKSMAVQQAQCNACEVLVDENGKSPLNRSFPIQVEPYSAQSNEKRVKIREAVNSELLRAGIGIPWDKSPVCVTVIALVPRQSQTKDVDNLAKGVLDAMNKVVYKDDRQIQCLTTRRIEYAGLKGSYWVSIRAVRPWSEDVVFDDPTPPEILWGQPVVIK